MKPILLTGEMVRSTLAGLKTKTRRPLKPQPDSVHDGAPYWNIWKRGNLAPLKCPFGKVGDRLWVRETFCLEHQVEGDQPPPFDDGRPILYLRDGIECAKEDAEIWIQPHYRATDPTPELSYYGSEEEPTVRWKSSIHMPRWASRITLEITEIRVERVQEITEEEAISEGFFPDDGVSEVYCFSEAWDSLYAKKGLGWYANPWVWVITFRRVEG